MKRILLAAAIVATLGLAGASTAWAGHGYGGGYGGGYGAGYRGGYGCAPGSAVGHHHHGAQQYGPPVVLYPHRGHYHVAPAYPSTYYRGYNTPYYGGTRFGIQTNTFRFGIGF
jgi:hypothetical protein